ncbi:MAG: SDR family oxidoreductase [Candidatus Helarchaeota archaeon]
MNKNKVALITGANRGLGFESVRQLANSGINVILTARNEKKGIEACKKLENEGNKVFFQQLDVTNQDSIKIAHENVLKKFGKLDILINNAGVYLDKGESVLSVDLATFKKTIETNVFGALLVTQIFVPLMIKNKYGRIVNVSSEMGQISSMDGRSPSYKVSKAALNALTRIFASELSRFNILVNSVCPGWTKTTMGGPYAPRSIEEGVDTIIYLATLPDNGPTGGFFKERKRIDW